MVSEPNHGAGSAIRRRCPICSRELPADQLVPGNLVRPEITDHIRAEHPEWESTDEICSDDLHRFRMEHIRELVSSETELSDSEADVLSAVKRGTLVTENVNETVEETETFGERVSDVLASFGGSWPFIGLFVVFLVGWMATNAVVLAQPVDPFPFILLNLMLSCLAAIQAPIILMSQNRQESRDRIRAAHDYEVNLNAELEIRQLHEKLDFLVVRQWRRLLEIQELQSELIDEIARQESEDRE